MKHILLAASLAITSSSCTDDLDQYPHKETTSKDLYKTVDQYESVLAKLYASYTVVGQGKGGDNADLPSNNGFDFGRSLFNLQEATTDEVVSTWLEGDKLTGLTYHSWDANDSWVADTYYRAYYSIAICNEFLRQCTDHKLSSFSEADQNTLRTFRAEARFAPTIISGFLTCSVRALWSQRRIMSAHTFLPSLTHKAYSPILKAS